MDRDNVINSLNDSLENLHISFMDGVGDIYAVSEETITSAIAMLKEQMPVEPVQEQDSMVCGVCGHEVIWQRMLGDNVISDEQLSFCPHCGRVVKWE